MTHGTLRYSFEIDGNTCGQMDVHRSSGYLRTVTEFETTTTGHVLADFEVWFDGLNVVRARKQPFDWVVFSDLPDNALPDCAYPLLLQRSLVSDFEYWCIDLEQVKGHVLHQISRTDDLILETRDNQVLRRFSMDDDIPTWIDWGGARSRLLRRSTSWHGSLGSHWHSSGQKPPRPAQRTLMSAIGQDVSAFLAKTRFEPGVIAATPKIQLFPFF